MVIKVCVILTISFDNVCQKSITVIVTTQSVTTMALIYQSTSSITTTTATTTPLVLPLWKCSNCLTLSHWHCWGLHSHQLQLASNPDYVETGGDWRRPEVILLFVCCHPRCQTGDWGSGFSFHHHWHCPARPPRDQNLTQRCRRGRGEEGGQFLM